MTKTSFFKGKKCFWIFLNYKMQKYKIIKMGNKSEGAFFNNKFNVNVELFQLGYAFNENYWL